MDARRLMLFSEFIVIYHLIGAITIYPGLGVYAKPLAVALFLELVPARYLLGYTITEAIFIFPLRAQAFIEIYRPMMLYYLSEFPNSFIEKNINYFSLIIYVIMMLIITLYYPYYLRNFLSRFKFYQRIRKVL